MTYSSSPNHIFYITKEDVLIALHQQSGRWCSLGLGEISNEIVPDGIWDWVSLPLTSERKDEILEAVAPALDDDGEGAWDDDRSFEYMLVKCTSECNYCCTYCYDHDEVDTGNNLNAEEVCRLVKEGIESSSNGYFTLLFHGGEPLLRFEFVRRVAEFAKDIADKSNVRLFFKLQTHGGLFSDAVIEFLDEYDFFVGVSVDGPKEINDKHRVLKNGSGTYHLFESAYKKYRDFMKNNCGIVTTPTTISAEHFLNIARHFRDMGFRGWRTTNFLAVGRVQDDWSLETDESTYVNSVLGLIDAIEDGEFDGFYIDPVISFLTNLLSDERPNMCMPGNNSCGAGRRFISVEADGAILPCDTLPRDQYVTGQISENNLNDILAHQNAQNIADSLPRNDCKECVLLGVCGGTCLGLSTLENNRPFLCKAYKKLYPELMYRMHFSERLREYYESCMNVEDKYLGLIEQEAIA